jgi:hypothetical protein
MKESFKNIKLRGNSIRIINTANEIITDYREQGFTLTLRQLYYQFVSRDMIENTEKSYKNLGGIINDGRMCGMIDWSAIEDRTRNLKSNSCWVSPSEILKTCAESYHKDHWESQDHRVEVWVEKEALAGVAEAACVTLDVPFFCCKGYTSQSEMYSAAQRLLEHDANAQTPVIIHLGDHDPSGIDMSRDIKERLDIFTRGINIEFTRIALNRHQIDAYNPPPNPAKVTDSRFRAYQNKHGDKSWELDALEPKVLVKLIQEEISQHIDRRVWAEVEEKQEKDRAVLVKLSKKHYA